jgi:energy-coupling factor transport system ATP-binding protein
MSMPVLSADQVSFAYPQEQRGLSSASFEIEAGQGILISGLSGSGKSTLARCLSGLIPHLYRGEMQGQVRINQLRTDQLQLWQLSEQAGLVFQNPAFQMLAPTVEEEILFGLENLGLPRVIMKDRLEQALTRFNLQDFRSRSPHTLSGGEQQKLALASITARQPKILILDEPLSMLDSTSAIEFVADIEKQLADGLALVICEHREKYVDHLPDLKRLKLNSVSVTKTGSEAPLQAYPQKNDPFSLEIHDLSVNKQGNQILSHVNLTIPSGKVIALVGRNGTGKTTLFRAIAGFQHHNGMIRVKKGNEETPAQFNMIFQNPDTQLFNPTVQEEILYKIFSPDRDFFHWILEALNLTRYKNTPPLLLSEGEKRRVALATALMHRPKHGILLDEPSLGQDSSHKRILINLCKKLAASGLIVFLSTHDLELAAQTDQLILLGSEGIIRYGHTADVWQDAAGWEKTGLVHPVWMETPCSD